VSNKSVLFCPACWQGKFHKLHFGYSPYVSQDPLDLIYLDVWGPAPLLSSNNKHYFLCIVDDLSKYFWLLPLTCKSEVFNVFSQFKVMVEKYFSRSIKAIQTDGGGEFVALQKFLASHGISHRKNCPHTHHQNGSVERKHRQIVDTGLSLLSHSHVPFEHWDLAFETECYLINRIQSSVNRVKSPFELLFHQKPDYNFLKVFGCECWLYLRPYNSHKFSFRSKSCIFLGYSKSHLRYRCLDITTGRLYIARHVRFNETVFPFQQLQVSPLVSPSTSKVSFSRIKSCQKPPTSIPPATTDFVPAPHSNLVLSPASRENTISQPVALSMCLASTSNPCSTVQQLFVRPAAPSIPCPTVQQPSQISGQESRDSLSFTSVCPTISANPTFHGLLGPHPQALSPNFLDTHESSENFQNPTSHGLLSPQPHALSGNFPDSRNSPTISPSSTSLSHIPQNTTVSVANGSQSSNSLISPSRPPSMITRSKHQICTPTLLPDGSVKYPLPSALTTFADSPNIEPTCYTIAAKYVVWREAMADEFTALLKSDTWSLVSPTPSMNIMGSK
jgi:hypothetical protein